MMVLVDTTVWIDFFAGRSQSHVASLETMIEDDEDLCICGVILTEVLQGIRSDSQYSKTRDYFSSLILLPMYQGTFERAADLYRSLRKKGVTIRKPSDCMIAAVAIQNDLLLLHNDRDFDQLAEYSKLKIMKTKKPTRSSNRRPRGRG